MFLPLKNFVSSHYPSLHLDFVTGAPYLLIVNFFQSEMIGCGDTLADASEMRGFLDFE